MTEKTRLTEAQEQILRYLRRCKGDDRFQCANWIAEGCGHFYDTPWASGRLPGLIKRGLIERGGTGYYAITPAGLSLLGEGE